jgi:small-conductance mechanosensitive channel
MENKCDENQKLICRLLAEHEEKGKNDKKIDEQKTDFKDNQLPKLICWSWIVLGILSFIIIVVTLFLIFSKNLCLSTCISILWDSIAAGILGSTCAALLSALDRIAHGWEDKDGNKYPKDEPKDKFNMGMVTFFLFRPVFGILAGLLVYFGLQTKYIGDGTLTIPNVIFWSLLCGLFVKTLIDKLKSLFESFVGAK